MMYSLKRFLKTIERGPLGSRKFYSMSEVMGLAQAPANSVFLRFDVERALSHHAYVARLLAAGGIRATFYFHTRRLCYDPPVLREIQDLGHEIGYHHECLDRCGGDFGLARELFLREIEQFRTDGLNVLTVCGHGEAGLPSTEFQTNWDLFPRFPGLLTECGLHGEVYEWLRAASPLYASDTFSNYSRFWDTLAEADSADKPLMVLVHLHRWRRGFGKSSLEISRDIGQHLANRILGKRTYKLGY